MNINIDHELKLNGTYYSAHGTFDPYDRATMYFQKVEFRGPEYTLPDGTVDDLVTDPALIGALTRKLEDELTCDTEPDYEGNHADWMCRRDREEV